MAVPIQNIYYLLCYAWDRFEGRDLANVGEIPGNRVENLLAKVLDVGVGHLIRQGLDRGYIPVEEEGRRLRGKILFSQTVRRSLLQQGQVACRTDDLSHDVPHNRVIKGAMRALVGYPDLDGGLRTRLRDHCRRLHDVADVDLSPALFRQVQLHRNVARYALLINVASLVARTFLPEKGGNGRTRFHPFMADEREMGRLFELFVRKFLAREQRIFRIGAEKVPWDASAHESDLAWLPEMRTDIVLSSASMRVVIEAKCYAEPFHGRDGGDKLRSTHLYQLLTYLAHMSATAGPKPTGILLYAGVGEEQRRRYRLGGYEVEVRTLDLDQDWQSIHQDLLALVGELEASGVARATA